MPVKIPPEAIKNLQQIEAVVAGPDDANRLFIIDGQLNVNLNVDTGNLTQTFAVLIGPVFTSKQFRRASATVSVTHMNTDVWGWSEWNISDVDDDLDNESGQVELRIETYIGCAGPAKYIQIVSLGFHVTILAAVAAA